MWVPFGKQKRMILLEYMLSNIGGQIWHLNAGRDVQNVIKQLSKIKVPKLS